ncbi:MAG: Repeat family protein [Pedosphaera sp.]|nr:Repeat family protein [Pedosphaera sp.]
MKAPSSLVKKLFALVLVSGAFALQIASATTFVVSYGGTFGLAFSPSSITINAGDTVVWTNNNVSGAGSHTITGNTAPDMFCGSGTIPVGCSHTFSGSGVFAYHCIPHAGFGMTGLVTVVSAPPSVSLAGPGAGSVFAAPANVKLSATATSTGGSVTNVQFFGNGSPLGSITASPFNFTANGLAAGAYSITAKATAGGVSATSAPVSITVVNAKPITNFLASVNNGQFTFDHTADAGLRYVVENSTNLISWSSLKTNTATSNSVHVTDSFQVNGLKFYRVGRLPNP